MQANLELSANTGLQTVATEFLVYLGNAGKRRSPAPVELRMVAKLLLRSTSRRDSVAMAMTVVQLL